METVWVSISLNKKILQYLVLQGNIEHNRPENIEKIPPIIAILFCILYTFYCLCCSGTGDSREALILPISLDQGFIIFQPLSLNSLTTGGTLLLCASSL